MNSSANVNSLDALRDLRSALIKFREESASAMTSVEVEIRRALDWLSHDQLKYWQHELRLREDAVGEAKTALARRQLMKNASGETPSADEEKKQVAIAKRRVEEAEDKIKLVKKWTLIIEQEIIEFHGPAQQLDTLTQTKLPIGVVELDRRINSLEAYLATQSEGVDLGLAPTTSEAPTETKP